MLVWVLVLLQKLEIDGASADNLTSLIMSALNVKVEFKSAKAIAMRLICFGTNAIAAFQGHRTEVKKQIWTEQPHFFCPRSSLYSTPMQFDIQNSIFFGDHIGH